jgi:hypothetical protein
VRHFFQPAVRALHAARRHPAVETVAVAVLQALLDPLVREVVDALLRR